MGLIWFVAVSFLNGFIIEIGRKIRAAKDEEEGVETYSMLWGRPSAVRNWLLAMTLTYAGALMAGWQIRFLIPVALVLGGVLLVAAVVAVRFLKAPKSGKAFETLSGLWTLCLYLVLGIVPLAWRWLE